MRGEEYGVRHLTVSTASSLLAFISELVSQERAQELIALGAVYVNDERALEPSLGLRPNDKVRAHLEPRRFALPFGFQFRIAQESEDSLIVDKPSGLPVHALVDNAQENLITYLERERRSKLFVTHRLDVDTCGLVVLAKNAEAQRTLNDAFAKKLLKRTYVALIENDLPLSEYVHYMEPSPKAPKQVQIDPLAGYLKCDLKIVRSIKLVTAELNSSAGAKPNSLQATAGRTWSVIDDQAPKQVFEVEIELGTGRTHQIRSQLTALGSPIIGDAQYGSQFKLQDPDTGASAIALWAFRIQTAEDEKILRPS